MLTEVNRTMTLLEAATKKFVSKYPTGAHVYDKHGREIKHVTACNPVTGEVLRIDSRPPLFNLLLMKYQHAIGPRLMRIMFVSSGFRRRHGFWPAPLTLVPIKAP